MCRLSECKWAQERNKFSFDPQLSILKSFSKDLFQGRRSKEQKVPLVSITSVHKRWSHGCLLGTAAMPWRASPTSASCLSARRRRWAHSVIWVVSLCCRGARRALPKEGCWCLGNRKLWLPTHSFFVKLNHFHTQCLLQTHITSPISRCPVTERDYHLTEPFL